MSQNEHDAGDKIQFDTPKQVITLLALTALVPIVIIVLVTQFITNMRSVDKSSAAMAPEAVAKRLKPAGDVAFSDSGGSAVPGLKSGEEIYKKACSACHASGAAGAPKFGDKSNWAARIKEGQKRLVATAIKGEGAMPPRGGSADLSDLEVERAVVYMVNSAGGKFKEPAAPAPEKTSSPAAPAPEKTAAPAASAAATGKADGKKIYEASCSACHGAGVAGAPKAGDKAAWAPRLKSGAAALYASAIKGKGAMPAKGGNTALADADVNAAVDYLMGLAK